MAAASIKTCVCKASEEDEVDVIRHFRVELVSSLSPSDIKCICDKLYANVIISLEEYGSITSERHLIAQEQAREMLNIVQRRGDAQKAEFVTMVCDIDGVRDLGRKMKNWQDKRSSNIRPECLTASKLQAENSKLRAENSVLHSVRKENIQLKTENQKLKMQSELTEGRNSSRLIEHALRLQLDAFGDGSMSYTGCCRSMQCVPLPNLCQGTTANCVASVGEVVFASSWAARSLYSLDLSANSPTWVNFFTSPLPIWNAFTWQNRCCIRAGADNRIYYWSDGDRNWNPLARMPNTLTLAQGSASLVAKNNQIYRLGGYNGDSLDIAAVYDVEGGKQWNNLQPMPFQTRWCSSAVVGQLLYAAGGCMPVVGSRGTVWSPIRNITVLDIRSRDWMALPFLEHYNATISSVGDHIVACGGCNQYSRYDENHDGRQLSVLDLRSRRWLPLLPTLKQHTLHGMCSIGDGRLAVVAGKDSRVVELLLYS